MRERDRIAKAVAEFADEMRRKMLRKLRQGYHGWDRTSYRYAVNQKMLLHAGRLFAGDTTQAVDVANLAMMLVIMDRKEKPDAPADPENGRS